MCEMNQEPEYEVPSQEEEEEDDDLQLQEPINFSNLHHDSFKNNHQIQNRHPCTPCACNVTAASNPMKRPSPEQISEPKSKKPSLDLSGFSKLPLPQLQRSVSDPFTPTKANVSEYAKGLEDTPLSKGSASSSALPPKAPVLSRTRSEPIVSPVKSVARSSISNDLGIESIKEESHSAKVSFFLSPETASWNIIELFSRWILNIKLTAEVEENEAADERDVPMVG